MEKCSVYVDAVVAELDARKDYLKGEAIETIYLGGGTPSQLPPEEVKRILSSIIYIYNVREGAEITLEANPDDVTPALLKAWRGMGINRLSMGVQTFQDERLRFLNRRHTSAQAIRAVGEAHQAGFDNLSIDLMFGFPGQTLDEWRRDVQMALSLHVQHLSAYSLMYEEGTRLNWLLEQGEIAELDEELSVQMYDHLIQALTDAGYRHYELSNFALPGRESRHNSSYWHGIPYLGVGAGAHSFDGLQRCFHPDSLEAYLAGAPLEVEQLTEAERYDEFVFTGLRTAEGIRLDLLEEKFGKSFRNYCLCNAQKQIDAGRLVLHDQVLHLSHSGLFVSNDVMSDLMWVE